MSRPGDLAADPGQLAQPGAEAALAELPLERLAGWLDEHAALLARSADDQDLRRRAWLLLDLVRRTPVLQRIEPAEREAWAGRILALVEAAHFTVGPLFRQRAERYANEVLFETPGRRGRSWTWRRVATRVEHLARVLLSLESVAPVAVLAENSPELALLDLACLGSGCVNVMIPATATESDVGFILRHCGARTVVVSGPEQQRKVLAHLGALPEPRRIFTLEPHSTTRDVVPLDALADRAGRVARADLVAHAEAVRIGDLATIMYTSGTTGSPKGIQFSQRNLVFKRFARALALPQIGDRDVFLCYLPLYHTFGRFLELLGCVFWGARYCFLASTSAAGLVRGMKRHRPTVFISVPKKWIQLHERITQLADPVEASDEELRSATQRVTGGRLALGLSAAGHLDPEIFRFFGRQGVELLSGFGMTEATGGISMTAPGAYRDGSLGRALPGIELRLAEDGELLIRGPYVMEGYLDPPQGEGSFDAEGWLHTGDLMRIEPDGQLELVDRKKEIYKNVKGETIAPQRIENLFRDFESVGRAFLVGDHREYNTLLIYPNAEYCATRLATASTAELRDHFRSLVVSANKFLAPYERVVDFALIDRDLDAERDELTAKGTPRRKIVERNFGEVIRQLYRRTSLRIGGMALTFPNWLLQLLGITAQDIRGDEERIVLSSSGIALAVRRRGDGRVQVGSCVYRQRDERLDLGSLLITPRLWLGNEQLVAFAPLDTVTRRRGEARADQALEWAGRAEPYLPSDDDRRALALQADPAELDLLDVDLAARMLAAAELADALAAVGLLERILGGAEGPLVEIARVVLGRASESPHPPVRRRAFQTLVRTEHEPRFASMLARFLRDPELLDAETRAGLAERTLTPGRLEAFVTLAERACAGEGPSAPAAPVGPLLAFLGEYGAAHPMAYRRLRVVLERVGLFGRDAAAREQARRAAAELQRGFRQWLGPTARIAVDPETGQEYRWAEVVAFDEQVPPEDRARLLQALEQTALLREGVFLFSKGATVRLNDIPPRGVSIRLLGARHGKSVYRITVQTRFQDAYDLAANVNHGLSRDEVDEEIRWLILSGQPTSRAPLVEDFGGYWPEQDLWSEEFIEGETLERAMRRLARRDGQSERLSQVWPFLAWATLSAYVDFWNRTGRRLEIADPGRTNIIVPTEDYLQGVRIVSLSRRTPHAGLLEMLATFRERILDPAEAEYPQLSGLVGWSIVFSSVLEVIGEQEGSRLLRRVLDRSDRAGDLEREASRFLNRVATEGFVPMRLHFAVERYRRWVALGADPTLQARALTLSELYGTYGLDRLAASYPAIRARFFLETVFRDRDAELVDGLKDVIRNVRSGELELADAVDELRSRRPLDEEDEYFLARLSYPYLRPEDSAGFVSSELGGRRQSEIVVGFEDEEGRAFRVRHALNPKEVERLLQLFLAARLYVRFRSEHQYLVAIDERGQIIGGIYYRVDDESRSAHLEKIVVAERYRRKGVADGLMREFFNRLRTVGVATVTTGFFRPEYFYGFGFRIEKRYAGLVKTL